ncbi:YSC84-related protein [Pantoea sp. 18069]|uniref:BPSL1445 family SYLF domain-containing lipoprotein n=1 Tax=Pantoea sp. 18069 TaxID=2681415 RepID=UPI001358CAE0|nr:YSC84-related protein [Pantoea sp. 18069]
MMSQSVRSLLIAATVAVGGVAMLGCTTTSPSDVQASPRATRGSLDAQVDATLTRLYATVPGSRELVSNSKGVLVFPTVVGGSFVVGAEHGRGALRSGERTLGYYSTTAASIGWQAGGQSKAVIYVFNTQDALDKFLRSEGWSAGVDATVAVGRVGATGMIDTQTAQAPVTSFVMTNAGLEAGVSLQGAKISKINM